MRLVIDLALENVSGKYFDGLASATLTDFPIVLELVVVLVLDSWSDGWGGGVVECWKFLHSKQEVTGPLLAS